MRRFALLPLLFVFFMLGNVRARVHAQTASRPPHLLRDPSLSDTLIAFRYADDIWTVSRDGGAARRLTSTGNVTGGPFFSPDGTTLAYDARSKEVDSSRYF